MYMELKFKKIKIDSQDGFHTLQLFWTFCGGF